MAQLTKNVDALLFVVTPDSEQPELVAEASEEVGVRDICGPPLAGYETPSRSSRLASSANRRGSLLAELIDLFEVDGLLSTDDTVIVAARWAWPEYSRPRPTSFQPDRSFRPDVRHLGFYAEGQIQMLIPKIRARYPSIVFSEAAGEDAAHSRGRDAGRRRREGRWSRGTRSDGESYGVFVLSGRDDPDTVRLEIPIENDTRTESGRSWAWTLSQRYTSLDRLRSGARCTSEL